MQAPGWFGKLPMLGDFAQRRLPPAFVERVDAWLSQGVAASREALGEAWLDTYLTAPLWCFAWAPGVIDESWWFGVMMPSVDAVGRYFPLLVACTDAAPGDDVALDRCAHWYEAVCDSAVGALKDGATLESFEAALEAIGQPVGRQPHDELPTALRALAARLRGQALWWPHTQPPSAPHMTLAPGLPLGERFTLLLRGRS